MALSLKTTSVIVLALLAWSASAQAQETLHIAAHDDGGDLYFTVEGLEGENPTIALEAGTDVTIEFTNEGPNQLHNLHFGDPIDEQTDIIDPGETRTLEFTVPSDAEGTAQYWCDPHQFQAMGGEVAFSGAEADPGDDGNGARDDQNGSEDGNGAPGPAFFLVAVAIAFAAARRR